MDIVILMALAEFFEIHWQKGDTLRALLLFNQEAFNRSPLLYLLRHTGFIFILFIMFFINLVNMFTISILIMKLLDISFKLRVVTKLNTEGKIYLDNLLNNQDFKISKKLRYSNIIIYPILLLLGLF